MSNEQLLIFSANSGYGAIGNQYFRYFNVKNAEAITLTGQVVIQTLEKGLNSFLSSCLKDDKDRCILSDTDSLGFTLDDVFLLLSKEEQKKLNSSIQDRVDFIDLFSKETLLPKIQSTISSIESSFNAFPNFLFMKRENICSAVIVTGKKHYIMDVYDSEGVRYQEPKKKIMGIESVKASTPPLMRNLIKYTINFFFTHSNDHLIKIIGECKSKIFNEKDIVKICFPKTVNGLQKYSDVSSSDALYTKGTPLHVKGSLLFNKWIKENRLSNKYESIQEGEKIKYAYLKIPNLLKESVIAWSSSEPPKELKLETMLDFEQHFQIGYMNPIQKLLDAVGWVDAKIVSANDLF